MRGCAALFKNYQFSLLAILAMILTMLLASCGGGGGGGGPVTENRSIRGYNPGVGPFDNQGNYVERWANDKSKGHWWRQSIVHDSAATTQAPVVAANTASAPKPKPTVSSSVSPQPTVASAPRPVTAVKVQPASKPPIRHTVKSGDTLWGLSQKYKTTVKSIQTANGMKGTNLKIGRKLIIPRY